MPNWGFFNDCYNLSSTTGIRAHAGFAEKVDNVFSNKDPMINRGNGRYIPFYQYLIDIGCDSRDLHVRGFAYIPRNYAAMWRFDIFRPLYGGLAEYVEEFLCAFYRPISLELRFCSFMLWKLKNDGLNGDFASFSMNALTLLVGTIYFAVVGICSVVTSLIGLFTRPISTLIYECAKNLPYVGENDGCRPRQ